MFVNCNLLLNSILIKLFIMKKNDIVHFFFRYPNYEFVSDSEISKSAGLESRYSDDSLHGIIFDIQMLSECDFLVCTFSSQVSC